MWLWRGCWAGCDGPALPRYCPIPQGHKGLAGPSWGHSEPPLGVTPHCSGTPACLGHGQQCASLGKAAALLVLEGLGGHNQAVPPSCARPGVPRVC